MVSLDSEFPDRCPRLASRARLTPASLGMLVCGMSVRTSSVRYPVAPRDVPVHKAARRLHLTEAEFDGKKEALFARGFPRPDPTTGMYDLRAIDAWMDARHTPNPDVALTGGRLRSNGREVRGERLRRLRHGH
jgi:hypothetical protein